MTECEVYDALGQYNLKPTGMARIRVFSVLDQVVATGVNTYSWQDISMVNQVAQSALPSFPYLSSLVLGEITLAVTDVSFTNGFSLDVELGSLIRGNELIAGTWSLDFSTVFKFNQISLPLESTWQTQSPIPVVGNGISFLTNLGVGDSLHLKAKMFFDGFRCSFK